MNKLEGINFHGLKYNKSFIYDSWCQKIILRVLYCHAFQPTAEISIAKSHDMDITYILCFISHNSGMKIGKTYRGLHSMKTNILKTF